MDPVHDNWERFCRYHVGDWHGTWTRYSCAGVALASFRCIRSFHVTPDASVLTHQNHYDYADGRRETKTFGPYTPSTTRVLFIDQSFSWGSPSAVVETPFAFETGFRWADRRVSCVVQSNVSGLWQPFLVIAEHLGRFTDGPPSTPVPAWTHGDHGTRQTMTPDRRVAAPTTIPWEPLEDFEAHYLTCRLPEGVAVSVPRRLEPGTPFRGIVEWAVDATLLQRGIRAYDATGFAHFSLDIHRCSA
jgi:Domain of unknown function (DUF3598)